MGKYIVRVSPFPHEVFAKDAKVDFKNKDVYFEGGNKVGEIKSHEIVNGELFLVIEMV